MPKNNMNRPVIPDNIPALFVKGTEIPEAPASKQDIAALKGEAKRVVKRIAAIVAEHRHAAVPLGIELTAEDLRAVLAALRGHARDGSGLPVPGARDEIHSHVLNRLFEELVEEPSNILFTTATGPDATRYDAMEPAFWIECLDLAEKNHCP